jgi:hypothetical protein
VAIFEVSPISGEVNGMIYIFYCGIVQIQVTVNIKNSPAGSGLLKSIVM